MFVVCAVSLGLGCGVEGTDDTAEEIAASTEPLSGGLLFREDFESIGFGPGQTPAPYDGPSNVQTCERRETCSTNSLATVDYRSRKGNKSLRVRLRDGDQYEPGKSRAELSFRNLIPGEFDTDYWYAVSILVPESWVKDANEQKVVTQFTRGVHSPGLNPVLGLRITGGDWQITREIDEGDPPAELKRHKLRTGDWTDWVFGIRWSPSGNGRTRIWCNGTKIYEDTAQNIHPRTKDLDHSLKIGLYGRFTGTVRDREIFFDRIRVARGPDGYDAVAP